MFQINGIEMADITKRTNADGTHSYRVRIRLRHAPIQTATFSSLSKAKRWAQATETAIREGQTAPTGSTQLRPPVAASPHTVADLVDRYLTEVLPQKPRSAKAQGPQLLWWKEQLGETALSDLTPAQIAQARDQLLVGMTKKGTQRCPATVVRYLAALGHALSVGYKEWGWLDHQPMRRVSRPREPRGRVRYLDNEERIRLLGACQESESKLLLPIVVLALSTGMRQGEILSLCWKDVDLHAGRIVLEQTKNGERRRVPLQGVARDLLLQLAGRHAHPLDFVFPSPEGGKPISIRTAWETAVRRAGLTDFHFHDLRHSAASYLAMSQATPSEIAEVLGHKTLQMVKRYAHLSESHTSALVARMNQTIFETDLVKRGREPSCGQTQKTCTTIRSDVA